MGIGFLFWLTAFKIPKIKTIKRTAVNSENKVEIIGSTGIIGIEISPNIKPKTPNPNDCFK